MAKAGAINVARCERPTRQIKGSEFCIPSYTHIALKDYPFGIVLQGKTDKRVEDGLIKVVNRSWSKLTPAEVETLVQLANSANQDQRNSTRDHVLEPIGSIEQQECVERCIFCVPFYMHIPMARSART